MWRVDERHEKFASCLVARIGQSFFAAKYEIRELSLLNKKCHIREFPMRATGTNNVDVGS